MGGVDTNEICRTLPAWTIYAGIRQDRRSTRGTAMNHRSIALVLAGLVLASGAQAGGDPAKGKVVFQRCAICHRVEKDGGNGLGPNLFGVVGRKAGTVENFAY